MITCVCNNLPQEKIRETIKMHPEVTAFVIHDLLSCNIECGICLPEIHEMIESEYD